VAAEIDRVAVGGGLADVVGLGFHGAEYGGGFRPWYGRPSAALVSRYHQGRRRPAGGDQHPQLPAGLA
jgi:hypothetical protein